MKKNSPQMLDASFMPIFVVTHFQLSPCRIFYRVRPLNVIKHLLVSKNMKETKKKPFTYGPYTACRLGTFSIPYHVFRSIKPISPIKCLLVSKKHKRNKKKNSTRAQTMTMPVASFGPVFIFTGFHFAYSVV